MGVRLTIAACMVSFVSSYSYTASTLPDIANEEFIKDCVHIHNKLRSEVNPTAGDMLYMTWDPALARIAKAWAKNCQFEHNFQLKPPHKLHPNFTSLGENIWTGSLSLFSVSSAVTNWYDEVQYYDFSTRKCTKVCGHYTQVVWADSYKVGCAVQFCSQVSGLPSFSNVAHFICNYGPPVCAVDGNTAVHPLEEFRLCPIFSLIHDEKLYKDSVSYFPEILQSNTTSGNYPTWPYKKGATCSACPQNDKCLDNLCVNTQRDNVKRYYSVVYPDWPITSRNRYTSLFLIVNSVLLILSVVITIWVKHKYPNLVLLD